MLANSIMAYIELLGLSLADYTQYIALDIVRAEAFGEVTRRGFVDGWKEAVRGTDISDHKKYVKQCVQRTSKDPAYFKQLYQRAFLAGKESQHKALGKNDALIYWGILFDPAVHPWRSKNVNWLEAWTQFLTEKWTRTISKDLWNQTLLFATKTMEDDTLSFWSEDQAWPSAIDDFVGWCRETGVVPAAKTALDGMEVDA